MPPPRVSPPPLAGSAGPVVTQLDLSTEIGTLDSTFGRRKISNLPSHSSPDWHLHVHAFTDTYQGAGEKVEIILTLSLLTLDLRTRTPIPFSLGDIEGNIQLGQGVLHSKKLKFTLILGPNS